MTEPLVCVVMLTWDLKYDAAECLASVFESDYPNYRVLVVDNASTDGSPEYLKRRFPQVEMIVNASNLRIAPGYNIGIQWALTKAADYVLLLNNDIVIDRQMIRKMVTCAEADETIGIIAPKGLHYSQKNRIWALGARRRGLWPIPRPVGWNEWDDGQFTVPLEMDWVPFCAALIKRAIPEAIGLLDPQLTYAFEDLDYCWRVRNAGYRVVCEPRARLWHKVSLSAQKDRAGSTYLRARSRGVFFRRHPYGSCPWLISGYVWVGAIWRAARNVLRGDARLAERALRGLYDGYFRED